MAHRDVECGMVGIGVGDQVESAHNQEDTGPGVTVSGTVLAVSREPSGPVGSFQGTGQGGTHATSEAFCAIVPARPCW
jgi:hypothetical protein